MSNFSQVRELLQHNQQLHSRTAQFYIDLSKEASDERVKMLLNTLVKHEQALATELKNYMQQAPFKILNTYFQFDHEHSVESLFEISFPPAQITTADVENLATHIDNYFYNLYQEMLENADHPQVKELFENLHEHILEEKKKLSIDIYSLYDM